MIISTIEELMQLRDEAASKERFRVEPVKFHEQDQWNVEGGYLAHRSGGFFQVIGLQDQISAHERLYLYQPQSALTGLIISRPGGKPSVLLSVRFEPGNSNFVQFGPTIQSTAANYLRVHGGKPTPYYRYFSGYDRKITPLYTTTQIDLEHRYYQKTKVLSYLWANETIELEDHFVWVTISVLSKATRMSDLLNPDLRSLLIMFDWSRVVSGSYMQTSAPRLPVFRESLMCDIPSNWRTVPLSTLTRWKVTEDGIIDTTDAGLDVRLYAIQSQSRETNAWIQPLFEARGDGLVQLGVRNRGDTTEYLISHVFTAGVGPAGVILPSMWQYNGEAELVGTPLKGSILHDFTQSDEGGRFIRHSVRFQIIEVDENFQIADYQQWISQRQLIDLLGTSNLVGFSLRISASAMLGHIFNFK